MGIAYLYKGLSDDFDKLKFVGVIKDNIDIDFQNTVIINNGNFVTPDFFVNEDDIIFIRKIPEIGLAILGVLLAVGVGAAVGVIAWKNQEHINQLQAEYEENARKSKAASEAVTKLPFIRGAGNRQATGNTFPYIIGTTHFSPYTLNNKHMSIAGDNGSEQFFDILLCVGFNDLTLRTLSLGDTVIKRWIGDAPQEGVWAFDDSIYFDNKNLIEIRQRGDFENDDFNYKFELSILNKKIPHRHAGSDPDENKNIEKEWMAGLVEQLPSNTMSVEVFILFDGLRRYDNGWQAQTVTLKVQWSNIDAPKESDWHDFDEEFNQSNGKKSNTFNAHSRTQMRFSVTQDFTASQAFGKNIKVRLIRTTPQAEANANDSVYLLAVQSKIYDYEKSSKDKLVAAANVERDKRDKLTRLGVRIIANDNTSDLLDSFSCVVSGHARIWNGLKWSRHKTTTRNCASWVLELLTSSHHSSSQYNDDEIDLESFGELFEYCESEKFYADGALVKSVKKIDTLNQILSNCNASLYISEITGKLECYIDNGRDYSIALLNPENVLDISFSRELKRKVDGYKVSFVDENSNYEQRVITVMRDGDEYSPDVHTVSSTALQYVTSWEHAHKVVWRQLAIDISRPWTCTVKVGYAGAYYPIYDCVELQHYALYDNKSYTTIKSVTWSAGLLKLITLWSDVEFEQGKAYGIVVNTTSKMGVMYIKVYGTGVTNKLEVSSIVKASDDRIPSVGDIVSFGNLDINGDFTLVSQKMLIVDSEPSDDGITLKLQEYDERVYKYGALPKYRSLPSAPQHSTAKSIEAQRDVVTPGDVAEQSDTAAQQAADLVSHGSTYISKSRVYAGQLNLEDIIRRLDEVRNEARDGIQISDEAVTIKIQDLENDTKALLAITASRVAAMVEGGGSLGALSLSLTLPSIIPPATAEKLIAASSQELFDDVYAPVEGSDGFAIRGDVSPSKGDEIWRAAVKANLLSSLLTAQADEIIWRGKSVFTNLVGDDGTTIINGGKIKADAIDVDDIMTKDLVLKDGGTIRSINYNRDGTRRDVTKSGIYINSNGLLKTSNSEFENCVAEGLVCKRGVFDSIDIQGGSSFTGEIFSGPLELSYETPTAISVEVEPYTNYKAMYNILIAAGFVPNNYNYVSYNLSSYNGHHFNRFAFIVSEGGLVDHLELIDIGGFFGEGFYVDKLRPLKYKFIATQVTEGAMTFKLNNLPTLPPDKPNHIWNDKGVLKITS